MFLKDNERLDSLIKYLEVISKFPTNGKVNNIPTISRVKEEIESLLFIEDDTKNEEKGSL